MHKILAVFGILSALSASQKSPEKGPTNELFLVADEHNAEWCAYRDEASWRSRVDALGADTIATFSFSNDHLTSIEVTTQDETVDWLVIDNYTLGDSGEPSQLQRRANILPGDRSVVETFLIIDGKLKLKDRSTTSLKTGQKLKSTEQWIPEVPIITRKKDFPFADLMKMKYSDVIAKGKACSRTTNKQEH